MNSFPFLIKETDESICLITIGMAGSGKTTYVNVK